MPEIQLQLCQANCDPFLTIVAPCEVVPLIGDVLDLADCTAHDCRDEHQRSTFLVFDVHHEWIDARICPVVKAAGVTLPIDEQIWSTLIDRDHRFGNQSEKLWPWRG